MNEEFEQITEENNSDRFYFLKPNKEFWVTPILLYINLLFFLIMISTGVSWIQPESSDLLTWGANFRHDIMQGDYWRLFSSIFLHIGILHLFFNLYALVFIGFFLEPVIGSINFLLYYLITGLVASISSVAYHPFTVSAGASGAIFGMYGLFLALLTTNLINKPDKKSVLASIVLFILFNLSSGFSQSSGIDNAAHIGGLLSGFIFGYILYPIRKFNLDKNIGYAIGILLLASVYFYGKNKISNLNDPAGKYETFMNEFARLEEHAISAMNLMEGTPTEVIISHLDDGLKDWEKCQKLLAELANEELPHHLIDRNTLLQQYVVLRIDLFKLYRLSLIEKTTKYDVEISQIVTKTQEVMQMLQ